MIPRLVVGSVGLTLIIVALFLYEDEEGRLQSRLENLWIRIDEARLKAVGFQGAFLTEIARVVDHQLSLIRGEACLSSRSLSIRLARRRFRATPERCASCGEQRRVGFREL